MARASRAKPIPAEQLPAEYLTKLVGIVRDNMRTLELASQQLRLRSEKAAADGIVPAIDAQMTMGLLNLAKTNAELSSTYPGLLELANADRGLGEDSAIGGKAAEERLREALESVEPRTPR